MKQIVKIPRLLPLADELHKGTAGRALCVGGAKGMSGSIIMSAKACLKSGAGLVTIACPKEIGDIVEIASLETMTLYCQSTHGFLNKNSWENISQTAIKSNSLLLGPGMGRTKDSIEILRKMTSLQKNLVIDADALYAFSKAKLNVKAPTVLTPHVGEMSELIGAPLPEKHTTRRQIAVNYAKEKNVILVLKSHQTIVTDGLSYYEEKAGNPGMAKGGSGDVLAGTITAFLLLKDLCPFVNVIRAVHLHSLAADLAVQKSSKRTLIATEIISHYHKALLKLER